MTAGSEIVVVGGGIYGLASALELNRRGYSVALLEAGAIPNPLAASTDISKVVRIEYGADEDYTALGEESREGWLRWNDEWTTAGGEALYHETGVVMCCMRGMSTGGYEHDSFETLKRRGHAPERLDGSALTARFPAWRTGRFVDGFFHAKGGYVESGRVLEALAGALRRSRGVRLVEHARVTSLLGRSGAVTGVVLEDGATIEADHVVVAAGAWTSKLCPELERAIRPTGHPVFHLRPEKPDLFRAECFPTYTADVARTGYYGFPLNRDGVVKIGVHSVGVPTDPDDQRIVPQAEHERLRNFLHLAFPDLLSAEVVYTRLCLYADTPGEDFVIDRHPSRGGLTVSSGGSGHGFKFGPALGALAADAVEGHPARFGAKFSWRRFLDDGAAAAGREAARCHDPIELTS